MNIREERQLFVLDGDCAWCGGRATDCHEILAGSNRHKSYHERACWLRFCREHHNEFQSSPITWQLALKLVSDPEGFSIEKFCEAWGRPTTSVDLQELLECTITVLLARGF